MESTKKKIMIIHHSGLLGGAGISLYSLVESLKDKYSITVVIPRNPPGMYKYFKLMKIPINTFNFTLAKITYYNSGDSVFSIKFWIHLFRVIFQICYWKKFIYQNNPDLVIVNSKVLCWMSLVLKHRKSICIVRETLKGKQNDLINLIIKKLLSKFTFVSFLSKYDSLSCGINNSIIFPDYLKLSDYVNTKGKVKACSELKISSDTFNILFMGGINRHKGIDLAVKAINLLKTEKVCLIVAGNDAGYIDGNNKRNVISYLKNRKDIIFSQKIKKFIRDNGLSYKVKWVGIQNDISTVLSASDIVIFPMKIAHQARPVFEAGAQKKPIIITGFDNIREYVEDGVNGLTFEPNNYASLADKIIKLKNNPEMRKTLGENNYKYTKKYHIESIACKSFLDTIGEII